MKTNTVTRISGIDVADDRFVSVNGPPMTVLPDWGLQSQTGHAEYHLHPAITYEVHYQLPCYLLVHTYNVAEGRFAVGNDTLAPWRTDARGTCLVPPGMRVRIIQETPLEFLGVGIAPEYVESMAKRFSPGWQGLDEMFKTVDPAMTGLCTEIRRSMIAEPVGNGAYLDSLLDAILIRTFSWHLASSEEETSSAETLSPSVARRVAKSIDDQLDGPIRVGDLAERAGLSRSHFTRAFTDRFGVAPQGYILSRRIARARTMLVETETPVTDIAMNCGFSTPSHLTTAFKHELGLTPSEYRRALGG